MYNSWSEIPSHVSIILLNIQKLNHFGYAIVSFVARSEFVWGDALIRFSWNWYLVGTWKSSTQAHQINGSDRKMNRGTVMMFTYFTTTKCTLSHLNNENVRKISLFRWFLLKNYFPSCSPSSQFVFFLFVQLLKKNDCEQERSTMFSFSFLCRGFVVKPKCVSNNTAFFFSLLLYLTYKFSTNFVPLNDVRKSKIIVCLQRDVWKVVPSL